MRIPTKTRYSMRFMIDLAARYDEGYTPMKDIAQRHEISKKYLEQTVVPLNEAGLLEVARGKAGGFRLSRPPAEISLAEIMSASEGGLELLDCFSSDMPCSREDGCLSRQIWGDLQSVIEDYLSKRTLADVLSSKD